MYNLRVEQTNVVAINVRAEPDINDANAVQQWITDAQRDLDTRQRLILISDGLWNRRQNVDDARDRPHTQLYLSDIRDAEQGLLNTLQVQVNDVRNRRAALDQAARDQAAADAAGADPEEPDEPEDTDMEVPPPDIDPVSEANRVSLGNLTNGWVRKGKTGTGGHPKNVYTWVNGAGTITDVRHVYSSLFSTTVADGMTACRYQGRNSTRPA